MNVGASVFEKTLHVDYAQGQGLAPLLVPAAVYAGARVHACAIRGLIVATVDPGSKTADGDLEAIEVVAR